MRTKYEEANYIRNTVGEEPRFRSAGTLRKADLRAVLDFLDVGYDVADTNAELRAAIARETFASEHTTAEDTPKPFSRYELGQVRKHVAEVRD